MPKLRSSRVIVGRTSSRFGAAAARGLTQPSATVNVRMALTASLTMVWKMSGVEKLGMAHLCEVQRQTHAHHHAHADMRKS